MEYSPVYNNNPTLTDKSMSKEITKDLVKFDQLAKEFILSLDSGFLKAGSGTKQMDLKFIVKFKDEQLKSIEQVSVDYAQSNETWRIRTLDNLDIVFKIQRSTFDKTNVDISVNDVRFQYNSLVFWYSSSLSRRLGINRELSNNIFTFIKVIWNYKEQIT